jgi:hypothetical protein
VAPSLGVRTPAPRLALRGVTEGNFALLTAVSDRSRRSAGVSSRAWYDERAGLLRATLGGAEWRDEVFASVRGPIRIEGLTTDAPLAVLRLRHGALESAHQAGGTTIAVREPDQALAIAACRIGPSGTEAQG